MQSGLIIASRYRVERLLGRGGMGEVWAARHIELGARVAIKFLRDSVTGDDHQSARFRREARAVAQLRGEHVVGVQDFGVEDGLAYLVMEHVEGETLAARLARTGPLPVELAARFALEACLALAEAHALGIVHRDLKPQNMLCANLPGGLTSLKVFDFGIATRALGADTMTRTSADALLGSPAYMSPEQIRDPHGVDGRADVWALGVTLFELVSGVRPFDAFTAQGVVAAVAAEPPRSLAVAKPDLPAAFVELVEATLVKDREGRVQNVAVLAERLAPFVPEGAALARAVALAAATPPPTLDDAPLGATTSSGATAPGHARWLGDPARSQPAVTISRVEAPLVGRERPATAMRVGLAAAVASAVATVALAFAASTRTQNRPTGMVVTPMAATSEVAPSRAPTSPHDEPSRPAASGVPVPTPSTESTRERQTSAAATRPPQPRTSSSDPAPQAPPLAPVKSARILPDPDTLGGRN